MRSLMPLIAISLAWGGCASSQSGPQPTTTPAETAAPNYAHGPGMGARMHGDTTPMGNTIGSGDMATCPMAVEGTSVRSENTQDGVAIAFTTTGDVAELRKRVASMAEMYNQHRNDGRGFMMHMMQMHGAMQGSTSDQTQGSGMHGGGMHGGGMPGPGAMHGSGMHGSGSGMMGSGMMMPQSTARVEDTDGGARLLLTPIDPAQLATLQHHAQQMAQHMGSRECPMLEGAQDQSASAQPPARGIP